MQKGVVAHLMCHKGKWLIKKPLVSSHMRSLCVSACWMHKCQSVRLLYKAINMDSLELNRRKIEKALGISPKQS